jgi:anti-sigma regulatory factor (Ser/Thr protein kinase)
MTSGATTSPRGETALVHAALLYRDPVQLRLAASEFVSAAALAGEPVLAVLPGPHLELLQDVLDGAGGELERRDMAEVGGNPGRLIPMLHAWLEGRPTRSRVISEPLWPGRDESEAAESLRHEALLNHALAGEAVSVLCPFDAEHLDAELIVGAKLTHPRLIDHTGTRSSEIYGDPLDVARGENWPQSDPDPPVLELPFDGDLWALRRALWSETLLSGLAPERREDFVFAINEAVSNALRHGDGTCRTRLWQAGDRIVSEVRTSSAITDPLAGRRRPAPDATNGRGLWLINQVCDLVELRSGPDGASLRMHIGLA